MGGSIATALYTSTRSSRFAEVLLAFVSAAASETQFTSSVPDLAKGWPN
jgi:hypothetical protein